MKRYRLVELTIELTAEGDAVDAVIPKSLSADARYVVLFDDLLRGR